MLIIELRPFFEIFVQLGPFHYNLSSRQWYCFPKQKRATRSGVQKYCATSARLIVTIICPVWSRSKTRQLELQSQNILRLTIKSSISRAYIQYWYIFFSNLSGATKQMYLVNLKHKSDQDWRWELEKGSSFPYIARWSRFSLDWSPCRTWLKRTRRLFEANKIHTW